MTVTNVTPPTISGTTVQGSALHATSGTWTYDNAPISYAYQWERCDAGGANCADISSATASSYILAAADVGHTLRVRVTATEGPGPPPSPPPGDLAWAPPGYPTYAGYETYTVTNANPLPTATPGTGRNVVATIGEALTGALNIQGWNNVVIIGGAWDTQASTQKNHAIGIYDCTGIVHLEGLDIGKVNTYYDACIGVQTGPGANSTGARVQIQNCRLYSGYQSNIGSGTHDDVVQNWNNPASPAGYGGGARGYRFDHCTFIAGYQGTFFGNHSAGDGTTQPIGNEDSYISNCNYVPASNPRTPTPIYYWKSWRTDPWGYHTVVNFQNTYIQTFTENVSIIPNKNGGGTTIPGADSATRGYTLKTDADGSYIEWLATSDQQGIIRIGTPPDGDFCPVGTPGLSYVSPGYV